MTKEYTFRIYQFIDGNGRIYFNAKYRNRFGFWCWLRPIKIWNNEKWYHSNLEFKSESREALVEKLKRLANEWVKRDYLALFEKNALKVKITLIETTSIKGEYKTE